MNKFFAIAMITYGIIFLAAGAWQAYAVNMTPDPAVAGLAGGLISFFTPILGLFCLRIGAKSLKVSRESHGKA